VTGAIPNIQLRNWRTQRHLSRAEMADRINATPSGVADRLPCDEERIRRWESGEVRWPSPPYRRALKELTGLEPAQLGFIGSGRTAEPPARIEAADAFRSEAELVDTLDLARMVTSSDLGQGTLDALQEAAELLCRAYPSASAGELRARTKQRLNYISRLLHGRLTWPSIASCWSPSAGWRCCSAASTTTSVSASKPRPPGKPPTRQACKRGTARSSPGPTRWPGGSP
jgi:transcriptional regulator with XRE-family HTH domain